MMRARRTFGPTTMLLFVALLGTTPIYSGCRGQLSEQPPVHLNPNMDQQSRLDPQEPNPFFRDNRAMREFAPGTVARPLRVSSARRDSRFLQADDHFYRGYQMKLDPISKEMAKVFFDTLPTRVPLTSALLARGQERFNIYCAPCHGFSGNGQGVVTLYERGFIPRNLHGPKARGLNVGQIYNAITDGNGKMMSLRSAIPPHDRWAIVAYVRALQLSRIPPR